MDACSFAAAVTPFTRRISRKDGDPMQRIKNDVGQAPLLRDRGTRNEPCFVILLLNQVPMNPMNILKPSPHAKQSKGTQSKRSADPIIIVDDVDPIVVVDNRSKPNSETVSFFLRSPRSWVAMGTLFCLEGQLKSGGAHWHSN